MDNKCSWVINTALSLATPAQRYVMEKKVKAVFVEIGEKVYEEYDGLSKHRG